MEENGYFLEHTTMMINHTSTNVTNIIARCETFNLTRTYYTYNITTDMIDDMMEENTIDKCNSLTYKEAVWMIIFICFWLFFPIYFISRSLHRL